MRNKILKAISEFRIVPRLILAYSLIQNYMLVNWAMNVTPDLTQNQMAFAIAVIAGNVAIIQIYTTNKPHATDTD